jgi:chromate transporter
VSDPAGERRTRLVELARFFLWLGIVGFGGPAAHLTLLEEHVVAKRRWISSEAFVDLIGLTNLIPGPNSTEMAMAIGYRRGGFPGLLIAGACFIVPAALMTGGLAWAYVRYGTLPAVVPLLAGIGPAIVAVMAIGAVRIGRTAVRTWPLLLLASLTAALAVLGVDPFILLVGGAAIGILGAAARPSVAAAIVVLLASGPIGALAANAAPPLVQVSLASIAWFFFKTGGVLYGSGYVLIALLHKLVTPMGWLTERQLLDAVAAGQVTPGPVLTTATFVGYELDGAGGAAVATMAIFAPAFLLVATMEPALGRLKGSPRARRFLDAVNATSVGLIAGAAVNLALTVLRQPSTWPAALAAVLVGVIGRSAAWMLLAAIAIQIVTRVAF